MAHELWKGRDQADSNGWIATPPLYGLGSFVSAILTRGRSGEVTAAKEPAVVMGVMLNYCAKGGQPYWQYALCQGDVPHYVSFTEHDWTPEWMIDAREPV